MVLAQNAPTLRQVTKGHLNAQEMCCYVQTPCLSGERSRACCSEIFVERSCLEVLDRERAARIIAVSAEAAEPLGGDLVHLRQQHAVVVGRRRKRRR